MPEPFLRSLVAKARWYRAGAVYGRQPGFVEPPPDDGISVKVPVRATISAIKIHADGTREDLGVLSATDGEIDSAVLDDLERQAHRED